jgi:hypothetical protein
MLLGICDDFVKAEGLGSGLTHIKAAIAKGGAFDAATLGIEVASLRS